MSRKPTRKRAPRPVATWWDPRSVPEGQTLHCELGTLLVDIHHERDEWSLLVGYRSEEEAEATARMELREEELSSTAMERYLYSGAQGHLLLQPMLADRPVVVRPRQSVFLPSGQETVMYISTPVFLRLALGDPPALLREIPMARLSDTWFGPSTREGELCYSDRTHARHTLENVPRRTHRAITPLHIRNDAITPLPLDKVSLPVPMLTLYGDGDGRLWTQRVSLLRGSNSDMASIRIDDGPPDCAPDASPVALARQVQSRGGLVRAFSLLFGD